MAILPDKASLLVLMALRPNITYSMHNDVFMLNRVPSADLSALLFSLKNNLDLYIFYKICNLASSVEYLNFIGTSVHFMRPLTSLIFKVHFINISLIIGVYWVSRCIYSTSRLVT
jgi:hypothetical protein